MFLNWTLRMANKLEDVTLGDLELNPLVYADDTV